MQRLKKLSFHLIDDQVVVEARINDIPARLIVDTGAGLNVISPSFCKKIGCKTKGTYTGERNSGESLSVPLTTITSLALGRKTDPNVPVAIFALLDQLPSEFGRIDGMVSLQFFKQRPFTLDYKNNELIFEDEASLRTRMAKGTAFPIMLELDRYTLSVSVRVLINGKTVGHFLVDSGTQRTNVDPAVAAPVTSLVLADAQHIGLSHIAVLTRPAFGGGVVGSFFLKDFVTTFDLSNWRLIFNSP